MQPLVYLSARLVLSYLQLLERHDRAFITSSAATLATGGGHCWAIVYSLMIAVLMQVVRVKGVHDPEAVPWLVSGAERLSSTCMLVWTLAGTCAAYIRIVQVDEHMQGLPVYGGPDGCPCPELLKVLQSRNLRTAISLIYRLSGVVLFCSVLLLGACVLLAVSPAPCDVCLATVAVAFALPHVAVALRRPFLDAARGGTAKRHGDPLGASLLAASTEAAAVAPQLCVILATADIYGQKSYRQHALYVVTTAGFLLNLGVSAWLPSHGEGMAVAPPAYALAVGMVLNAAASGMLVAVFPVLRDWLFWVLVFFSLAGVAALSFRDIREPCVEMMEPIMPFQSAPDKIVASGLREASRAASRLLALLSAISALTNALPDRPDPYRPQNFVASQHTSYDYTEMDYGWDMPWLLLRWRSQTDDPGAQPDAEHLLDAAARAMGFHRQDVTMELFEESHRVLCFRFAAPIAVNESAGRQQRWHDALAGSRGGSGDLAHLVQLADFHFPAQLNATVCEWLAKASRLAAAASGDGAEAAAGDGPAEAASEATAEAAEAQRTAAELLQAALTRDDAADAQEAYRAACRSWSTYRGDYYHSEFSDYHAMNEHHYDHDSDYHDYRYDVADNEPIEEGAADSPEAETE